MSPTLATRRQIPSLLKIFKGIEMTFPLQIIPTVIAESTFMKQIVLTGKVSAMWPSL